MGFSITNNVASINARNNLNRSNTALSKSVERLSSGLKINRGADGPASLVISEKQRAQISGLRQAIDNSDKAVSLVQTAEGALGEINSLLVKVRSLALDSANAGYNDDDALAANQAEITNALETIDRIASNTQFGQKKILDGSAGVTATASDSDITVLRGGSASTGSYDIDVTTAGERAVVTSGAVTAATTTDDEILTVNGVNITLEGGLTKAAVVDRINEFTDQTGAVADANGTGTALRVYSEAFGEDATVSVVSNIAGATTNSGFGTTVSEDEGVDIAGTIHGEAATGSGNVLIGTGKATKGLAISVGANSTATLSHETVTSDQGSVNAVSNALVFQIGANQNQTATVALQAVDSKGLGVGVSGNQFASLSEIDVTTAGKAQDTLGVIDAAIDNITTMRGDLGAFQQNTLTSTANNLRTTLENTINAESIIRDTNFAEEISNFTSNQVLVQAGTSVLGNANQLTQGILSLLQ